MRNVFCKLIGSHVGIRKLIVSYCNLGKDGTGLLTKIIDLYVDLEALTLAKCRPVTPAAYSLIPQLKKLSELNISNHQVNYVYVKQLQTHVCLHFQNTARNTLYIFRPEGKLQHF
jgi:hypothetical protein